MVVVQNDLIKKVLGFDKNYVRYILDPLHGQIGLTELENNVVKLNAFKRLKNVHQLGFISNVYPAATHKRYEHCIGTLYVTWNMFKRFIQNYKEQVKWNTIDVLDNFNDVILTSMRLAALLHDLGHGPYSHTFEKAASYFDIILDHDDISLYLLTGDLSDECIMQYFLNKDQYDDFLKNNKIGEYVNELKKIPENVREHIIGIYDKNYKMKMYPSDEFERIRYFIHDLLKGDIGSDRIDYLLRDTYFSGLGHRFNFSDLLDNIKGIYNEENNGLHIAIDENGKNIVEFIMMNRYYHYRLIAHNISNLIEEEMFKNKLITYLSDKNPTKEIYDMVMRDDSIINLLSDTVKQLYYADSKNLGTIGYDPHRFPFYRLSSDNELKKVYADYVMDNIVSEVNRRGTTLTKNDITIVFVMEKSHLPIIHIYRHFYLLKKQYENEKYSVLLHDHSILIKSLARTYLEDSILLILSEFTKKDKIWEYTHKTHHFYINKKIFKRCLQNLTLKTLNRLDFLLFAIYISLKLNGNSITQIGELEKEILNIQEYFKYKFYDFNTKYYYDPSSKKSFNYSFLDKKESFLLDDLYILDVCGLLNIKYHLITAKKWGKTWHSFSYIFEKNILGREIGLAGNMVPLEKVIDLYPRNVKEKLLDYCWNVGNDSLFS